VFTAHIADILQCINARQTPSIHMRKALQIARQFSKRKIINTLQRNTFCLREFDDSRETSAAIVISNLAAEDLKRTSCFSTKNATREQLIFNLWQQHNTYAINE